MTVSIVAQCSKTGQFGVAASTEMPAVGKLLTHARAGIGAVATQAQLNPYLGWATVCRPARRVHGSRQPSDRTGSPRRPRSLAGIDRRPLAERFVEALEAADALGGDREGEYSATIYIVDTDEYPLWDIRVDHHTQPMKELRRLHDVFCQELLPEIRRMPTRANPAGSPEEHPA